MGYYLDMTGNLITPVSCTELGIRLAPRSMRVMENNLDVED